MTAVVAFGLATLVVASVYRSPSQAEDPQLLAQLNEDQVKVVEIPGLGRVKFPDSMSEKEIETLIRDNFDKNRSKIPDLVKTKARELNEKHAIEARKKNDEIRQSNREVFLFAYGGWLAFVVLLYALGWSIGWIIRGFKAT